MKADAAFAQSLGARIRARRQALRLTQLGLALALGEGVSRATVCAWELGTRPVSAFDWARIEAAFGAASDQRERNRAGAGAAAGKRREAAL